jgi:hypothetical protein
MAFLALRILSIALLRSKRLRISLALLGSILLISLKIHPRVAVGKKLSLRKLNLSRVLNHLKLIMELYNNFS